MASLSDLEPELRETASRIPEEILSRLTVEELRHRAEYCRKLEVTAPASGEVYRIMLAHSMRVLRSLPVREAIEKYRDYYETAQGLPSNGMDSPAAAYRAAASKLRHEDNAYPPDLWRESEKRLSGGEAHYPEADLDGILGIEPVSKDLQARTARLMQQVRDYRQGL